MNRITAKQVESNIATLNDLLGRPDCSWKDGKAQVGHYQLYGDQCGYALHCIMNESGGVHSHGYGMTKREVLLFVKGMIAGVLQGKANGHSA